MLSASATSLSSSANPSVFGQSVTFTAMVQAMPPGPGTPTGTVTFRDGTSTLGTASLSGGTAGFTTLTLSTGPHTITVSYAGDSNFNASVSPALTQTVNPANTTTTVTSSLNPSAAGQPVAFSATVSVLPPGGGTPSGTVTFLDGATTLGTAPVSGGTASLATLSLSMGTHTIGAIYGGDTNFNGGGSQAITQTVNAPNSVSVLGHFPGLNFGQTEGLVPPDPTGAAGPTRYVESVNRTIALFNKSSGAEVTSDLFSDFFVLQGNLQPTDSGSAMVDPVTVWDEQIQRFIVGILDVDTGTHLSMFDIAVSTSASPSGFTFQDWQFYQTPTTEAGFDADFPGNFGYNHDAFVFTLNMLSTSSGPTHSQVITFNISDLATGFSTVAFHNDVAAESLRPTVMHDSLAGDPMWFLAENDDTSINVIEMINVLSNNAIFTTTTLSVTPYSTVLPPLQPDGSAITTDLDSRFLKAAEANNLIVASQAIDVSPTEDDIRWYIIDVQSGRPQLSDQGNVSAGDNTYLFFPSIDIDPAGAIGMSYMQSGTQSGQFMSVYVTGRLPGDVQGTMKPPVLVQAGLQNYHDFDSPNQRAGDLTGISVDSNGSFWIAGEFADTEFSANWGTVIVNFSVSTVIFDSVTPPSATEGITTGTVTVASFQDSDSALTTGSFTATIGWGDGSASTGAITSLGDGTFTVQGSHTYAEETATPLTFSVTVSDLLGATTTSGNFIIVADAALTPAMVSPPAAIEGVDTGMRSVATFSDANANSSGGDFSATISWGDGTTSAGIISNNGNGTFSVLGHHAYLEEGSHGFSVKIQDVGGAMASPSGTITIADAPLTINSVAPPAATAGTSTGTVSVATFSDANLNPDINDFTATIDWGDGTSATSGAIIDNHNGTFSVQGSHTYSAAGSFTLAVTVHDTGGASTSGSAPITVSPGAGLRFLSLTPPSPAEGTSTGVTTLATFTNGNPNAMASEFTASIGWGDGGSTAGTIVANGGGTFSVQGNHTYAEEGAFTLSLTVHDTGNSTMTSGNATTNVADVSVVATGGFTISAGRGTDTPLVTVATFTDPASAEALADYTATTDWGDSTSPSTATITFSAGTFTVADHHKYIAQGSFNITVTIHHDTAAAVMVTDTANVSNGGIVASGGFMIFGAPGFDTASYFIAPADKHDSNQIVATFTDLGGAGPVSDYSANIDWGDQSTSPGMISFNSTTMVFTVRASHTYTAIPGTDAFTDTITVTIDRQSIPAATTTDAAKISDIVDYTVNPNETININLSTLQISSGTHTVINLAGIKTLNLPVASAGVVIDDSADTIAQTVNLRSNLGMNQVAGLITLPTINYGNPNLLTFDGGNGGNTYQIISTAIGTTYSLNTGGGTDTVDVGGDPVNGTLDNIQGQLIIHGDDAANQDSLVFNDQAHTAVSIYTLANVSGASTFTRTGMAVVSYDTMNAITVNAGSPSSPSSGNTYHVESTVSGTTYALNTGSNTDTVDVGIQEDGSGSVQRIRGSVAVNSLVGLIDLTVDDSSDTSGRAGTVSDTQITGLAPATITYGVLNQFTIKTGSGGDNLDVTNTGRGLTLVASDLTLDGALNGNMCTLGGTLTIQATNALGRVLVSEVLTGLGGLTTNGPGTTELLKANNYTGSTIVQGGMLVVQGTTASLGTGPLILEGGMLENMDPFVLSSPFMVPSGGSGFIAAANLTINRDGTLNGELMINAMASTSVVVNGLLKDGASAGSVMKMGAGMLQLTQNNTYTGATMIAEGTAMIEGVQPTSSILIAPTATVGGHGTTGSITSTGGTINPGDGTGTGMLTAQGDVTFDADTMSNTASTLAVSFRTDGSSASELNVTGTAHLDNVDLTGVPFPGMVAAQTTLLGPLTILQAASIMGTAHQKEGDVFFDFGQAGKARRVHYVRSGSPQSVQLLVNDVTQVSLTSTPASPSAAGQPVTLTATVTSAISIDNGQLAGCVTFFQVSGNQLTPLGPAALMNNGTATFSTAALTASSQFIAEFHDFDPATAMFCTPTHTASGFSNSSSSVLSQTVNPVSGAYATRFAVASVFTHSEEHYIDVVSHFYVTILHRAADVPGLMGWVISLYERQLTDEQVEADFLIAPEYVNRHGGFVLQTPNPNQPAPGSVWVTALYMDILGRTPSATEVQGWVTQLASGFSDLSVASVFVGGVEKEQENIINAYQTFLGRAPSQAEIVNYLNQFTANATPPYTIEDLRRDFVSAPEYYTRPSKGNGMDSTWVTSAFQDVLGRMPSLHELNDIWVPTLAVSFAGSLGPPGVAPVTLAKTTPLLETAQVFTQSQGHFIDFVSGLYHQFLGRAPDVPGLNGFVNQLLFGRVRDEQVTAQFLSAPEYVNHHGGFVNNLPGQGWVVGLYNDVLGRAPSIMEIQAVLNALLAGQSAFAIALGLTGSQEKESEEITQAFMTLLGRAPTPIELVQRLAEFQTGLTVEQLRGEFVGSLEYFFKAAKGNGDNATWVRSAYADILFRTPSDHEVNDIWVPILQQKMF
jgi:autotransporter-associated beta strand protein